VFHGGAADRLDLRELGDMRALRAEQLEEGDLRRQKLAGRCELRLQVRD
jgi:hypothetical protein